MSEVRSSMKGAIQFLPKFNGIDFWVLDNKIWKRTAHQGKDFRSVRRRDAFNELRLSPEATDVILDWNGKNDKDLITALKGLGLFNTKYITSWGGESVSKVDQLIEKSLSEKVDKDKFDWFEDSINHAHKIKAFPSGGDLLITIDDIDRILLQADGTFSLNGIQG